MLHELLMALRGHCGNVFIRDETGVVKVTNSLPNLHVSEKALLNRLCQLSTSYTKCIEFIQKHDRKLLTETSNGILGLYVNAFCRGLRDVLVPYTNDIAEIEKEVIADQHLSLSHIQIRLSHYFLLLPSLSSVVETIEAKQIRGCRILDVIHNASNCGLPESQDTLKRLERWCHTLLFNQISCWMLHGYLYDFHQEFFIQPAPDTLVKPEQVDDDDDDVAISKVEALDWDSTQLFCLTPSTQAQYVLNTAQLPSYIPLTVAQKILFTGSSVQMFHADRKKATIGSEDGGSIFKDKEQVFSEQLHQLSQLKEFSLVQLQQTVNNVHSHVTEQLWHLVMTEGNLESQLRNIQDFFLLGRGELFLSFIDCADGLLSSVPSRNTEYDVNAALQNAARSVLYNNESTLQRFRVTLPTTTVLRSTSDTPTRTTAKTVSDNGMGENGWQTMNLDCDMEWPSSMVVTKQALKRYNEIFKFLLRIRRTQLTLQKCWAMHMRRKRESHSPVYRKSLLLLNHMGFLVNNLQYYLQVDVIDSQFTLLMDKLNKTKDFDAINRSHEKFVATLMRQCFLTTKSLNTCLNAIVALCFNFTSLLSISHYEEQQNTETLLEDISANFQRHTGLMFQILSSVKQHQTSPHLAMLLLRLDYNRYLTHARGKLGCLTQVQPSAADITIFSKADFPT